MADKERQSEENTSFLTDEEIDFLAELAIAYTRHGPLTREEVECVLRWANGARFRASMLDLVLCGKAVLTWDRDAHTVRFWTTRHVSQA